MDEQELARIRTQMATIRGEHLDIKADCLKWVDQQAALDRRVKLLSIALCLLIVVILLGGLSERRND